MMKDARASGGALLLLGTGIACGVIGGGMLLADRAAPHFEGMSGPKVETLFTLMVFVPLAVIAVIAARVDGARSGTVGSKPWRWAASGAGIGAAGLCAALLDARVAGVLVPGSGGVAGVGLLLWGAVVVLVQAGSEELFFRGWLQGALTRRWGALAALIGAAIAFSLAHLAGGVRTPVSLLNLLLGGLLFGALALRAGGLAPAIGAHWSWNAVEQLAFGVDPNPGVGSFGAIVDYDLTGPALWGGSEEGLNASLPMAMVLIAILAALAITSRAAARQRVNSSLPPAPRPSGRVP